MTRWVRIRYQVERVLAVLSAIALVLTLAVPDWIEKLLDAAPDGGNGDAEWGVVAGLLAAAVVFTALAWRDRRLLNGAGWAGEI